MFFNPRSASAASLFQPLTVVRIFIYHNRAKKKERKKGGEKRKKKKKKTSHKEESQMGLIEIVATVYPALMQVTPWQMAICKPHQRILSKRCKTTRARVQYLVKLDKWWLIESLLQPTWVAWECKGVTRLGNDVLSMPKYPD